MSITFGGLASGLDTNAIIRQLVALERRPITLLQAQKSDEQAKLDLMGTFEKLVEDLQAKAKELRGGAFFAYDLQVGTEGVADFQITGDPKAAGHLLKVFSLAAADRFSYDGVADPNADLGSGSIDFDFYDDDTQAVVSHTVTIAAGTESLEEIAGSINSQAGDVVTASVINTGTTAVPSYQLVITSDKTGEDYAIQNLTVTGIAGLTGQTQINVAANADVEIDGLRVERSTNLFNDVIEGISFTVSQAEPFPDGAETTFTVESDQAGIRQNLDDFVDAYNAVIDFIDKQETYSEKGGAGGLLFGDSSLRRVRSTIQGALFDMSAAEMASLSSPLNDGFVALGQIGIGIDSDGRLELDDDKVTAKLSENLQKFADLLVKDDGGGTIGDDDGAFVKLEQAIADLIKDRIATDGLGNPILVNGKELQVEGLFNLRRDTFKRIIGSIDDQIERMEYGVEKFEESLVLQFARLEELLGQLNAQGAYLSSASAFPTLNR